MTATGRYYQDGAPIMFGDLITDENGCAVTVFNSNGKQRVAVKESDLNNGMSASLGLFIIGGVFKVNHEIS